MNSDPLLSVDKEGLVRTIREQEQQIEKLRRENDTLRHELDKLKDKPAAPHPKQAKAHPRRTSKPPHLWGRKKGHKGSGRPQPDRIDRLIEQRLTHCPNCQDPLGAGADFDGPYKKLRRILKDADRLSEERRFLKKGVYQRRVRRIKTRLTDFACAVYRDKDWKRLSKRLLRHEGTLFTFLDQPGIPKDNNAAERAIRPQVIIRNRSFQNRTDRGAHAHAILSSLTSTLLQQKRNPLTEIVAAYPRHRLQAMLKLPPTPNIFAPLTLHPLPPAGGEGKIEGLSTSPLN